MENYINAELEIVALSTGDTISASSINTGENGLPIDPVNSNGTTYSL